MEGKKKRILFYGDSNTYGYDPRGIAGGRYPADARWPDLLAGLLPEFEVIAEGSNGLTIPQSYYEYRWFERFLGDNGPADLLGIMLGTNDWLNMSRPDPVVVARRMELAIGHIRDLQGAHGKAVRILLLAPPYVREEIAPMAKYDTRDGKFSEAYRETAKKAGVLFIDTAAFDAGLAFDGIHLSEEGHRTFAEHLAPMIRALI